MEISVTSVHLSRKPLVVWLFGDSVVWLFEKSRTTI